MIHTAPGPNSSAEKEITSESKPVVTVIFPNFNGKRFLEPLFEALNRVKEPPLEIIATDDGSTDGSLELLSRLSSECRWPVRIMRTPDVGPGGAVNAGASVAQGEFLAIIGNDTRPEADWLSAGLRAMTDSLVGACQCKLIIDDVGRRIDSVGSYLSEFDILAHRTISGSEVDRGQYSVDAEIFSVKSAAMIIRADLFKSLCGFDEEFRIGVDETDLCWRIWLSGYRVVYASGSRVLHVRGGTIRRSEILRRELATYYLTRNYLITVIKNEEGYRLPFKLLVQLLLWSSLAVLLLSRRKSEEARLIFLGMAYIFRRLTYLWRKRKSVIRRAKLPVHLRKKVGFGYLAKVSQAPEYL